MKRERNHDNLLMFIIDVLRHDEYEQLEHIVSLLNSGDCFGWNDHWPSDFCADEVQAALKDLVARGDVAALVEDANSRETLVTAPPDVTDPAVLWYSLNRKGRARWEEWTPPS